MKTKFAIGCLVQWYEIEIIEEYIDSLKDTIEYCKDKDIEYKSQTAQFFTSEYLKEFEGLNSSYLVTDGLDQGNKNFRESFLKVENKFSAKECKENECTIERIISSAFPISPFAVR